GPGIPKEYIGKALGQMLAGTKFHRYVQQRGQQGIGISGVVLFSQITAGKAVHIRSGIGDGKVYECDLSIDVKKNAPIISNLVEYSGNYKGLTIIGEFSDVKYDTSAFSPYEYLKATAMANPHSQIVFISPDGKREIFKRSSNDIPPKPKPVKPHPLGITVDDLITYARHSKERKLSAFLIQNLTRVSSQKIDELKAICPNINFDKMPRELKWEEAEQLVKAFKQVKWIAPSSDSLVPIGESQIENALKSLLHCEFLSVRKRPPKVYRGGVPFMVEVAIAYGGMAGREGKEGRTLDIKRFANKAPLLFDSSGCAITEAIKTIDWNRYKLKDIENMPVTIFVNFVSVFVPYTGAGKTAIASEDEIVEEIRYAIMEVARDLSNYISGKIREKVSEERKKAIMRYIKQLSEDISYLSEEKKAEEIEKKLLQLVEEKYKKKKFVME
ncbi:MAG: DNA topoisomerase VI subunit B, partial [Fervidobacterium sp.]